MTISPLGIQASMSKRRISSQLSMKEGADSDEDAILESPADLLCPITHELFWDPVINSAGQVYERRAIEKALAHRLVDPITNSPLETAQLTTVWPIRSKASAYRERAVRGSVARICQPSCQAPVRLLRRAAELCGGLGTDAPVIPPGVPGLSLEVVSYLLTHPSSIYDFQGLMRFAEALQHGHRDLAACVFGTLLQLGGDAGQQVEALQGLLRCWGGAGRGGEEDGEMDEQQVVEQLVALSCGEGAEGLRPAKLVDMLLAAGLPEELVVRFCERILGGGWAAAAAACGASGAAGGLGAAGCGGAGAQGGALGPSASSKALGLNGGFVGCGAAAGGPAAGPGSGGVCAGGPASMLAPGTPLFAELLYRYTRLRCGRLEALAAKRAQHASTSGDKGGGAGGEAAAAGAAAAAAVAAASARLGGEGRRRGPWGWLRGLRRRQDVERVVCSVVCGALTLVGSRQPLARVVQAVSLLLLLNPKGDGCQ